MLTEELRERINKLSHVKRQLLNQQLCQQRAARAAPSMIVPAAAGIPAAGTAAALLSHTQQVVWRTQAANPTATFYNFPQLLRLDGALDISALARALCYLTARHDVLRTRFALAGDMPYAVIASTPSANELRMRDLLPSGASALELEELLYQHIQRPFDLSADLPLSAQLVRVAPDHHVLSLVHHFAAFDDCRSPCSIANWATVTMPLPAAVRPCCCHCPSPTPTLPPGSTPPQTRRASPQPATTGVGSWPNAPTCRPAPKITRRPPVTTYAAGSFEFCLPAAMLQRLEGLAQHENATLFMLLLGSLQTLLARYTERQEVVVGANVANRPSLETELLLGNFSNRLLLWAAYPATLPSASSCTGCAA